MRILYVEDDARDADITVRMLRKTAPSFQVETASTIEAALTRLARLNSAPLDLVLLDVNLMEKSGLSLLKHVRETAMPVAVVVVTGMGDEDTAVAALKDRADDYIVKRKDYLDRLPVTLESALNHYRADAVRRTHPLKVLFAETNPVSIDETRRHLAVHADHIHLDTVSSRTELLSALQKQADQERYDVMLLDFNVPDTNALEVLRELRHLHKNDVPVVLICDENDKELARQGLKLGATSCIIKSPGYLYQLRWELEEAHSRAELMRREAALQESEKRFRTLADTAPVFVWISGTDKLCTYFNQPWLEFTGRTLEQELGNGWAEGVHADDLERCLDTYVKAFDERRTFSLEYRLRRFDGEYRWVIDTGVPRFTPDGVFIGYVGSAMDITERIETEKSLERALDEVKKLKDRLHDENIYLKEEMKAAGSFGEMIGQSEPLKRVLTLAEQVAPLDTTVLILGETGTGKELLAHAIHNLSPRCKHPLVKINCAALPGDLIESELFGHAKGAFTGASSNRTGRFELANHGTIFLDEVGELPSDLQAKLLRVLEQAEFEPVGSSKTVRVDVRVVTATNRNLEEEVRKGVFRSDLYYRLSTFPITMPPLRERKADIPILARHFVKELSRKFGKQIESIPQETMAQLKNYPWPGNIRELRNIIERAVIVTQGTSLRLLDTFELGTEEKSPATGEAAYSASDDGSHFETLEHSQYNLILNTLKKSYWRIEGPYGAAAALKVHPSKLRAMMKKLGITRPKARTQSASSE